MLALCITCMNENMDFMKKLEDFYPVSKAFFDQFYSCTSPQALSRYILQVPFKYPKQFFAFLSPIGLSLHIQTDLNVKLSKNMEFILELSAKTKEISHKPPSLRFIFTCFGNNKEEFKITREKNVNAAGICNIAMPIIFGSPGLFALKIKASVLNYEGREIGKPEFAEITLECV